jgi:4-amino-4-deoxy-L-arabinose transferase-like glycosyltransferase
MDIRATSSAEVVKRRGDFGDLRQRHRHVLLLVMVGVGAYMAAYLVIHLASPSGQFPVLDGAENMALARQIATGTLPHEPFYRAMLYPWLLSVFLRVGVRPDGLPVVAALLGAVFHLGSTLCVYALARRMWASGRAGLFAAGIYGFNPVAVYFAGEPLDTTFGLFLFLAGLNLLSARGLHLSPYGIAFGSALWALATLARPHYAVVLAALPVLLVAELWQERWRLVASLAAFATGAGLCLGFAGLVQKNISGTFHVMPVQGGYNLWAGNRPGANGRYFEQKVELTAGSVSEGENPARVESEILYRKETGESGPLDVDRMNAYWKHKAIEAVKADPRAWLGLMFRKIYFLLNNFEQYNNKTFAVQKSTSPVLRWNPLGWGISLVMFAGVLGVTAVLRRRWLGSVFFLAVAGIYTAGVLMFFVSDRFRLPLLPFICVGAGLLGRVSWRWLPKLRGYKLIAIFATLLLTSVLTFSRAWGVYDLSTAVQDYILLSIASGKAGSDLDALRWAKRALAEQRDHPDALGCAVQSFYNSKLQGNSPEKEFPDETWKVQVERVTRIPEPSSGTRLVQGIALWKIGHEQEAREVLASLAGEGQKGSNQRTGGSVGDDALGVLLLSGLANEKEERLSRMRGADTSSFYLLIALARNQSGEQPVVPENRERLVLQSQPFVRNIFP